MSPQQRCMNEGLKKVTRAPFFKGTRYFKAIETDSGAQKPFNPKPSLATLCKEALICFLWCVPIIDHYVVFLTSHLPPSPVLAGEATPFIDPRLETHCGTTSGAIRGLFDFFFT